MDGLCSRPQWSRSSACSSASPCSRRRACGNSTLWDWKKPLLDALGIKGEETSLRAWRRLCVDLYKRWCVDSDVHRLVTGHGEVSVAGDMQRDDRQDTLHSTYFDPAALNLEQQAQVGMQHMRTAFPATGAPYRRIVTDALQ